MAGDRPAIEIRGVSKDYRGLRPLRLRELSVAPGEMVAVSGLDAAAAAVLVDLITGAVLPDAGEVIAGGVATSSLSSQDAWLAFLDQFGIVNPRVVLLEALSVAQNLAVPLTLSVDPLASSVRARVEALAARAGLSAAALDRPIASIGAADRLRVRLGRAMALSPRTLLVEHPTLDVPEAELAGVARDLAAQLEADVALLVLTADRRIAKVATRALTWDPRTGGLELSAGWRRWLGG